MLITEVFPHVRPVPKNTEVGIEIEVEGRNLVRSGDYVNVDNYWTTHDDGSLRGNAKEYVLHTPIRRKDVLPALTVLKAAFKEHDTKISDSDRAGVHVHLNCQHLTVQQTINFILMYLLFEDILVRYCGEEREGNLFCLRARDAEDILSAMRNVKQNQNFGKFNEEFYRYASINIPALNKFGTLEFRSLKTPQNILVIEEWVQLLLCVKDAAMDIKDSRDIVEAFSKNGERSYLRTVFGKLSNVLEFPDTVRLMREGVQRIQEICYTKEKPLSKKNKYVVTNGVLDNLAAPRAGFRHNRGWVEFHQDAPPLPANMPIIDDHVISYEPNQRRWLYRLIEPGERNPNEPVNPVVPAIRPAQLQRLPLSHISWPRGIARDNLPMPPRISHGEWAVWRDNQWLIIQVRYDREGNITQMVDLGNNDFELIPIERDNPNQPDVRQFVDIPAVQEFIDEMEDDA